VFRLAGPFVGRDNDDFVERLNRHSGRTLADEYSSARISFLGTEPAENVRSRAGNDPDENQIANRQADK